jgi:hypothetical protein
MSNRTDFAALAEELAVFYRWDADERERGIGRRLSGGDGGESEVKREIKALRKSIWEDMTGCNCVFIVKRDGKSVKADKDDVCDRRWVRCNGRYNRIYDDYKKHGLKIGPVGPGESGLAE